MTTLLTSRNIENARSLARKLVENGTDTFVENFLNQYETIDAAMYLQLMNELFTIHRTAAATATAIHAVKRIVMALRSYSHVKQDVPEPVNIHDVIETSLIILANRLKHNITIDKRYGDLPPITVYGDELSQVWTNLLSNAAHAIDGQGVVTIETLNLGSRVAVKIRDTGRGIPPELIERIFDPFFTTKKKGEGTGLGLGIVSRIVRDRHGGEIEVTSVPGDTCFTVYLPIMVTTRTPDSASLLV
jgi:signal transduction histidine kinase